MRLMTMTRIALDTNVLIYLNDVNDSVRRIAQQLVFENPHIPVQVVSEYLNVCQRRLGMNKWDALASLMEWLPICEAGTFQIEIYEDAYRLMTNYKFQLFDAIIVSSALWSGCDVLYSEDMHNGLLVDGKLKIINPFINTDLTHA